jgi:histidinol-phosphate aminotransferase
MIESKVDFSSQTASQMVRPNIAAMQGYVPGEQPQAGKFIKLNTNENPYPPSSAVMHAISQVAADSLRRYPDPSGRAFRMSAADVLGVPADWILCGNGSDDILTITTRTFVGQGEKLRSAYPSYVLYKTLTDIQGADIEWVDFDRDWQLPASFSRGDSSVKLVVLANPNSPSGTCLTPDQVREFAQQLPCPLLVDEAYADFATTNCVELVKECANIMVSRTLSKSYALAGLRFGYVIAQPALIEQLQKVKDSYNCDAISIAAATAAIADQSWLADNVARILATRNRSAAQLAQLGLQVQPSQANFLWCTHPSHPLRPVYEQLKERRILVRYMTYDRWPEGIRISIGTDDQMEACVDALRDILT